MAFGLLSMVAHEGARYYKTKRRLMRHVDAPVSQFWYPRSKSKTFGRFGPTALVTSIFLPLDIPSIKASREQLVRLVN